MTNVIDLIDVKLLQIAAPSTSATELAGWVDQIKNACKKYNIDTVREVACFLAQSSHESGGFTRLTENLNYSAKRLTQVWPKRFPTLAIANQYAKNPQKLANNVYANRMGNGAPATGDGYRFRGQGLFQLTGRSNYTAFAKSIGMTVEKASEYIGTREGAAMSAAWYFDENGLDRLAATPGVEDETRAINGGLNGFPERKKHFDAIVKELLNRGA
jgi:putative chitinase